MVFDVNTGRDEYDMRYLDPDPYPYGSFESYLNNQTVLEAIGAAVNFTDYSNLVGGADGTVVGGLFGDTGESKTNACLEMLNFGQATMLEK